MIEIYKPIKEFENLYEISNLGNIRSLDKTVTFYNRNRTPINRTIKGKVLSPCIGTSGYYNITLHKEGKSYTKYIHRLVAEHFIENPYNYNVVNHKDEDKLNNSVENLEWCTYTYNNNYGTKKEKLKKSNEFRSKKVYMYDINNNLIKTYDSINSVKEDGFYVAAVWRCCNGKQNTHRNKIFKL